MCRNGTNLGDDDRRQKRYSHGSTLAHDKDKLDIEMRENGTEKWPEALRL